MLKCKLFIPVSLNQLVKILHKYIQRLGSNSVYLISPHLNFNLKWNVHHARSLIATIPMNAK